MRLGGQRRWGAHSTPGVNTHDGCRLPSAFSGARHGAGCAACSREKSGVHTGELSMKRITHENNVPFLNGRIWRVLLWVSSFLRATC